MTDQPTPADRTRDASQGRVAIENLAPEIDGGRFPIKRVVGERVAVEVDAFADGHDAVRVVLLWKHASDPDWRETECEYEVNDRWRAEFRVERLGRYRYTVAAWADAFETWRRDLRKRAGAGQVTRLDLAEGAGILRRCAERARGADRRQLEDAAVAMSAAANAAALADQTAAALGGGLAELAARHADRAGQAVYPHELEVVVEPERARTGAWYEMFPRSCSPEPGRHGTFRDCEERLSYVAGMGFDVLYLPPIHPIGRVHRKGKNNQPTAGPDDVGSPWAIGSKEGGHKSIDPRLGTIADFRRLVEKAGKLGIDVALDLAFQCAPDHPYVTEHPEWFRKRPDGSIRHAENPPKKYEDIVPFDFDTLDRTALWEELKSVVDFWIAQGVRIFRVDNPHTKPFPFWEWLIGEIKASHPEVIFLSEAFTRPKVMARLAKVGFSQSYTYFAWRNTRWEIERYLRELTRTELKEYFRPNFWPNTPDILTEYLQSGGMSAFIIRLVLAATLSPSYGIYGPAFELGENTPREPGSEEYLASEKYELRHWNIDSGDSLREIVARVNAIRRELPVFRSNETLEFHRTDNDRLICYSRGAPDSDAAAVVVVNLDPHFTQSGWIELPLEEFGLDPHQPYQMHDLLGDGRFLWQGYRNYVEIDPHALPAHIFRIRRRQRTERDFDYFM